MYIYIYTHTQRNGIWGFVRLSSCLVKLTITIYKPVSVLYFLSTLFFYITILSFAFPLNFFQVDFRLILSLCTILLHCFFIFGLYFSSHTFYMHSSSTSPFYLWTRFLKADFRLILSLCTLLLHCLSILGLSTVSYPIYIFIDNPHHI